MRSVLSSEFMPLTPASAVGAGCGGGCITNLYPETGNVGSLGVCRTNYVMELKYRSIRLIVGAIDFQMSTVILESRCLCCVRRQYSCYYCGLTKLFQVLREFRCWPLGSVRLLFVDLCSWCFALASCWPWVS